MKHPIRCALMMIVVACAPAGEQGSSGNLAPALSSITSADLMTHTRVLSSDAFEGRGPGTRGEDSTVAYLEAQFRRLGLEPGNPDGSYVQNVSLVGFTSHPTATLSAGGKTIALDFPNDFVGVSRHQQPTVDVSGSEVVFVGYGVEAPEYGWDDYKGVDVRGKTVLMLINDPPVALPNDSTQLDSAIFRGRAMTYYGRWTYKYEIASAKGAAAAIIVHQTEPAGYPYEVVVGSWGRENFDIKSSGSAVARVKVESWITLDKAKELLRATGRDFDTLKRSAGSKDFRPVSLGATATFRVRNTTREIQSRNVIARLPGSDSSGAGEHVVYTAHWDHLGRDSTLQGDQIFNGALDNASGTAALLELAEAFTKLPQRPERSILFLAVTAEEKNLLGARYYAENPLYPLSTTLANINMDGVNQWGRTRDVVVIGLGNSTLDDVLREVASGRGRTVAPDPEPEKGFFYRSDHFEFAKLGVPALYTDSGIEYIDKPAGYGETKRDEYTANDYHKPSDEVKPDWDLSGAVEDTQLLFEIGYRVAQGDRYPEWKPGTEFKARRDSTMKQR
jgi:Zn-dependent M28 family amino/carboxypeptidase